jgi:predicted nucleic acid-binding protein
MNYLLDTCVLSEFTRRQPDRNVVNWLDSIDEDKMFLSAISLGEVQRGIQRLPDSGRKNQLVAWLNSQLLERFNGRILSLDSETLLLWGNLAARMEAQRTKLPVMDSLIVATALQHHLILVTRNVSDFASCDVEILNPWIE